ncbi:MAG: RibD family protein, partial [Candidatus Marinamargulisbacteria bacterium]
SSPESLTVVHRLRTYVQAICVGANTIAVDQPRLSVRLPNYVSEQPMIIILDPHNSVDMAWVQRAVSKGRRIVLFQSHSHSHRPAPDGVWHDDGLTKNKTTNWQHVFSWLYRHGVQGVLIEGGCGVFQSILNAGYFDELWITKVPQFFSSDSSVPFLRGPLHSSLDITLDSVETHGADVVIKYKNNHAFKY